MPFFYRKSISLGRGMRMNFSKSGVGFSAGAKGFRVSTGPRGTYVNLGAGGIYYREKIAGPYGEPLKNPSPKPRPTQVGTGTATPISNAPAEQMVDATSASVVDNLNSTLQSPAYAPRFVWGGILAGLLFALIHPLLFIPLVAFSLFLASIVRQQDAERRTYSLQYQFDPQLQEGWNKRNAALSSLARSEVLWRVTSSQTTYDWKRNAGVSSLVTRIRVTLSQKPAPFIHCNLIPFCLDIGNQQLYFFPDRIYIYGYGQYGAFDYSHLIVNTGVTRFTESGLVPSDAESVGTTWAYVNKDGSPDRRFSNNRQLPIMNYGVIELQSPTGLNVQLHASSHDAITQFALAYNQPPAQQNTSQSAGKQQSRPQPPPYNASQQPRTPPPPPQQPVVPECYKILGLSLNCTREEATAKYREMASAYHPDRVNNLAPEFKALAHQKMTEINNAFAELKQKRGW